MDRFIVHGAAEVMPLYYNSSTNTIEDVRDQIALMYKTDSKNIVFKMERHISNANAPVKMERPS